MPPMTRFVITMILLACAWPCSVTMAGEFDVYESLSDIHIGRVFLSPWERARLDAGGPPPVVEQRETTPAPVVKRKRRPAGYFVSSSGASGIWSRRGFVAEEDVDAVVFPGAVNIVRSRAPVTAADEPGAQDDDD